MTRDLPQLTMAQVRELYDNGAIDAIERAAWRGQLDQVRSEATARREAALAWAEHDVTEDEAPDGST